MSFDLKIYVFRSIQNIKYIALINFPSTIVKREWKRGIRGMTIILLTLQINIYRLMNVNFTCRLFRPLVSFSRKREKR